MSVPRWAFVALSMSAACGAPETQELDDGFTVLRSADFFYVLGVDPYAAIPEGEAAVVKAIEPQIVLVWARSAADPSSPIDGDVEGRTRDFLVLPPGDYCPPVRARAWPTGAALSLDETAKPCELTTDASLLGDVRPCSLTCEETPWTLSLMPSE